MAPLTCDDVNRFIFSIAPDPIPYSESENAYTFGDPKTLCTGVAVGWWPGPHVLREAAAAGLNCVISHEDPILELHKLPLRANRARVPDTLAVRANIERMRLMVEHKLVVHRHHWNIDVAPWGIPSTLIATLGWSDAIRYQETVAWIVELPPTPLPDLVRHVKDRLGIPFLRVASPSVHRKARRIGIAAGGSGQSWSSIAVFAALGCDTALVGDMIHACAKMAVECDMAVLDCFHHAAEEPGLRVLADKIAAQFSSIPVRFYPEPIPWTVE